ncbi:MAG: membrane protein insertion efficiency factor YidD [Clostridia bacterium]
MKRILQTLIIGYQNYISPMLRPCCRFQPTCSQYALEAIEKHGALRGMLLAIWRVLRCNPFGKGGYDPVPDIFPKKKGQPI